MSMSDPDWLSQTFGEPHMFDPKLLPPYPRMGTVLLELKVEGYELLITKDAGPGCFVAGIRWYEDGLRELRRYYMAKVEGHDFSMSLETTLFGRSCSEKTDPDASAGEFGERAARMIRRAEAIVGLAGKLEWLKPAIAECHTRCVLDEWRQAEFTSACLEIEFETRNLEVVACARAIELMRAQGNSGVSEMQSRYTILKRKAEADCSLSDEYRQNADFAKALALEAILMLREVAPDVTLPVPDDLCDGFESGFRP